MRPDDTPGPWASVARTLCVGPAAWIVGGIAWPSSGAGSLRFGLWAAALVLVPVAALWVIGRRAHANDRASKAAWVARLALVFALARTSAELLVAFPRLTWVVAAALAMGWGLPRMQARFDAARSPSFGIAIGAATFALCLAAGLGGNAHEAADPGAYASVRSGVVLGANPRQSVSFEFVDGRAVDVVLDDYVEPRGSTPVEQLPPEARPRGDSVPDFAKRLETALQKSAETVAPVAGFGSARLHAALAGAEVELVPGASLGPPRDDGRTVSGGASEPGELVVRTGHALLIRSGLHGPGSELEVVCPGRRAGRPPLQPRGACPKKYAREANAGLGLSYNWPGYGAQAGRGRARPAALLRRFGIDVEASSAVQIDAFVWLVCLLALTFVSARWMRPRPAHADGPVPLPIGFASVVSWSGAWAAVFTFAALVASVWVGIASTGARLAWPAVATGVGANPSGLSTLRLELAWVMPLVLAMATIWLSTWGRDRMARVGEKSARTAGLGAAGVVAVAVAAACIASGAAAGGAFGGIRVDPAAPVRSWIEVGAHAISVMTGGGAYEIARTVLASATLWTCLCASVALAAGPQVNDGADPSHHEDLCTPSGQVLWWVAGVLMLGVLAWLSLRKPGLIVALELCACLFVFAVLGKGRAHAAARSE